MGDGEAWPAELNFAPDRQHCLAKGSIFSDSGSGELDHSPTFIEKPAFRLEGDLPSIELRARALAQIPAELATAVLARRLGDQGRFVVGPSVLDGVCPRRAAANHTRDFSFGLAKGSCGYVRLDIGADESPAKVSSLQAARVICVHRIVLFHRISIIRHSYKSDFLLLFYLAHQLRAA